MTLNLKHLRELCDAVIPSDKKWITNDDNEVLYYDDDGKEEHIIITDGGYYPPEPEYAAFIAATDPPTVRTLLDEIEALQAENARLRGAIGTAMPDLEYAAFNLTDYTESDVANVIDTTCSEKSLLVAIRDLKQALAAPIEKNTTEEK